MSLAIAHFAVGVAATALLVTLLAPRFLHSPTVLVAGGLWAIVPDVHHVLPAGSSTVRALHVSVWSDLFWFHHYIDRVTPEAEEPFAAVLIGAFVVLPACELFVRVRASSIPLSLVRDRHE